MSFSRMKGEILLFGERTAEVGEMDNPIRASGIGKWVSFASFSSKNLHLFTDVYLC